MKIEVNRIVMLEVAKNASRVAPLDAPVDMLNRILIECNDDTGEVFLSATNFEVSIQQKVAASVSESGTMLVSPRVLVSMLTLLSDEMVTISAVRPEVLKVSGGKCVYEINCLSPNHYPKPVMPFPEETVKLSGICSIARRTVFAVSKDEHKPSLQCVSIKLLNNSVHAAACDGARLMLIKDSADSCDECDFLLPGRSLQILASISADDDIFDVGDIGKEIAFVRGNTLFTMKKLSDDYVDVNTILKSIVPTYSVVTDANLIKKALNLLSVGADKAPLNLILTDGCMILQRENDYSEAKFEVPATVSKNTSGEGFYYDIRMLEKLYQVLEGRIKLELDAKGVMVAKTKSEVYVQMPQRAPARKSKEAKTAA